MSNHFKLIISVRQSGHYPSYSSGTLWPPFRLPIATHPNYEDPRKLLLSRTFHAMLFVLLYKAANAPTLVSEQSLALVVYLLDMAVSLVHQSTTQGNVSLWHRDVRFLELSDFQLRDLRTSFLGEKIGWNSFLTPFLSATLL